MDLSDREDRVQREDGSALILAAVVLVLLTAAGVVLLFASRTDVRTSLADLRAKRALSTSRRPGSRAGRDQLRLDNASSAGPVELR